MTQQQLIMNQGSLTFAHNEYEKQLKRYSLSKLNNPALAEDLVQDTFLKAWLFILKGGKINTMKSFLYQILNHLIIDEYRKGKKTSSLDDLVEKGFEPRSDEFEHIVDILDGKATMLLIEKLPKGYKEVLKMRYDQNLSLEEIALSTKRSRNAIAVQMHRGLVKLQKLFQSYEKADTVTV